MQFHEIIYAIDLTLCIAYYPSFQCKSSSPIIEKRLWITYSRWPRGAYRSFPAHLVDLPSTSQHASLAAASLCTGKAIQDYFFKGLLPPENVACAINELPFPPVKNATNTMAWMSADVQDLDDQRLLLNLKALGEEMQPFLMRKRH